MLDLRQDPVILEMPAFDSQYVSLMITGYDHYHTTFDPQDRIDEQLLAACKPLGVAPGHADAGQAAKIDGQKFREVAERLFKQNVTNGIDVILQLYVPDLENFQSWTPPRAEKL